MLLITDCTRARATTVWVNTEEHVEIELISKARNVKILPTLKKVQYAYSKKIQILHNPDKQNGGKFIFLKLRKEWKWPIKETVSRAVQEGPISWSLSHFYVIFSVLTWNKQKMSTWTIHFWNWNADMKKKVGYYWGNDKFAHVTITFVFYFQSATSKWDNVTSPFDGSLKKTESGQHFLKNDADIDESYFPVKKLRAQSYRTLQYWCSHAYGARAAPCSGWQSQRSSQDRGMFGPLSWGCTELHNSGKLARTEPCMILLRSMAGSIWALAWGSRAMKGPIDLSSCNLGVGTPKGAVSQFSEGQEFSGPLTRWAPPSWKLDFG